MTKQVINIINFSVLYNILEEVKNIIPFKVVNFEQIDDFIKTNQSKNLENLIVTKYAYKNLLFKKILNSKNIIFFKNGNIEDNFDKDLIIFNYPIQLKTLIEKINIQLIKKRYNYQSKIDIKNYSLDLNSRIIFKNKINLKLTEREIDIILFLNDNKKHQKVSSLQNKVWGYSADLETHTVETHIYRLRKKIKDCFKDENFIVSNEQGYTIW